MTKIAFLLSLNDKLSQFPQNDVQERLSFYSEMIEDRMEEGLSEDDAVAEIGSIDEIAAQIAADLSAAVPAPATPTSSKRLNGWAIVLLILGFPLWFSLLAAVFSVTLSLYVSLWALVFSLWAIFAAVSACALCGIAAGIGIAVGSNTLAGIALIGMGFCCAGIGIFLFYGCKGATKGILTLTKKFALQIRNCFAKKEETR